MSGQPGTGLTIDDSEATVLIDHDHEDGRVYLIASSRQTSIRMGMDPLSARRLAALLRLHAHKIDGLGRVNPNGEGGEELRLP